MSFSSDNGSQIVVQQPNKHNPISYVNTVSVKNTHREFYEEMVARKRYREHIVKSNNYSKAQKKFRHFQRQLHQIKSISIKEANGPVWFQYLSDKQISILEKLDVHLKDDMDMATPKNTKQALKALGVQSFIPNTVAMDALFSSKLYPVPYLTSIKDFIIEKDELKFKHTCDTKKVLSPETRILMSSILYLAFPRLIKKLDYCLQEPVPEKKLKYKKLPQPKQKSTNRVSPYLEGIPEPGLPWTELEKIKWHNAKVKKQRENERMNAEKQQALDELAADIQNRTTLKLKVDYPKHPFDKMFYDPARIEMFKHEKPKEPLAKCTGIDSDAANDLPEILLMARKNMLSEALKNIEPTIADEKLSSEFSTSTRVVVDLEAAHSSETLFPLMSCRSSRQSFIMEDDVIENNPRDQTVDIPENAHGLQYTNAITYSSLSSSEESMTFGNEHDHTFHDISDGMEECGDRTDEVKDVDIYNEKDSVKDGDNNQQNKLLKCGRDMDSVLMSGVNETEALVLRLFQALPNDDNLSPCPSLSHMSVAHDTFSIDDDDDESKTDSTIDQPFTSISMSADLNKPALVVDKRLSIYNMLKINEGVPVVSVEPSAPDISEDLISTTEQCHQAITEDNTINLEVFLATFRKLPPWKQLKAVLEFLSILGDPIAGFPDLIDLQQLKRWFSLRLNINRRMTPKLKRDLMNKSMDAWNMTRAKFTSVPVPPNPFIVHQNEKLITWDEIDITKKRIKLLKEEFTTGMKQLSINNARDFYTSTQNEYFQTPLNRNFKKIFYDYFPARENDQMLLNSEKTTSKSKKKF